METIQCRWYDKEHDTWHSGILVDRRFVVKGCFPGVIDLNEEPETEVVEFLDWVDLDDTIMDIFEEVRLQPRR